MTDSSLDLAAADLRVRRGSVPASTQLAEALQAAIVKQRLPRGGRPPSERELIDRTGLSRVTVRAAVGLLERQGCKRPAALGTARDGLACFDGIQPGLGKVDRALEECGAGLDENIEIREQGLERCALGGK